MVVHDVQSVAERLAAIIRKDKAKTEVSAVADIVRKHVEAVVKGGWSAKAENIGPVVAALRAATQERCPKSMRSLVMNLFKMAVSTVSAGPVSVEGFLGFIGTTTGNYITQGIQSLGAYLRGKNVLEWAVNSGIDEKLAAAIEAAWVAFLKDNPVEGLNK